MKHAYHTRHMQLASCEEDASSCPVLVRGAARAPGVENVLCMVYERSMRYDVSDVCSLRD